MIGLVPAANQIALAAGIFLLLPLGDWFSNRNLVSVFAAGQFLAILVMALAGPFPLFVLGSTLLGFVTIAPYLLPTYVSKRVPPGELGRATAMLTTGIIAGILVARAGAGVVGEYFGWRTVYLVAAILMLAVTLLLPLVMDKAERATSPPTLRAYARLLVSIGPIVRAHPEILLSGTIQGLSFGIFLSVWMGLGLHLTSPAMGFGTDIVGYLALFALVNLVTTPLFGAWADRTGPRRARTVLAVVQLAGVCLLPFAGHNIWLLMVPITIMNISGPTIDVTGRMTFLAEASEIRTRLMTVYIVLMFLGGGLASWVGTATYDAYGWTGNAALAIVLSILVLTLSALAWRWRGSGLRPDV